MRTDMKIVNKIRKGARLGLWSTSNKYISNILWLEGEHHYNDSWSEVVQSRINQLSAVLCRGTGAVQLLGEWTKSSSLSHFTLGGDVFICHSFVQCWLTMSICYAYCFCKASYTWAMLYGHYSIRELRSI